MRFIFLLLVGLVWGHSPVTAQSTEPKSSPVEWTVEDGYAAHEAGDYAKARQIMETLAAAGNIKAMNSIGIYHAEGKVYPKNREIACDWYEKSAHAGYLQAENNFGNCFGKRGGRVKDKKLWLYWKTKAAKQGQVFSQMALVNFYNKKEDLKTVYWARKAAAQGNVAARVVLWVKKQGQATPPLVLGR